MIADNDEIRLYMERLSDDLPEGWGAIVVLARVGDPEADVLAGGARLNRDTSIELLRELLVRLEAGGGS
jgi:hypothetical protein